MENFDVNILSITGSFPNYTAEIKITPTTGRTAQQPASKTKEGPCTVLTYADVPGNGDPVNINQAFTAEPDTTVLRVVSDGGSVEHDLPSN